MFDEVLRRKNDILATRGKAEARAAQLEGEIAGLHWDLDAKGKDLEVQQAAAEKLRKEERLTQDGLARARRLRSLAGDLAGRVLVILSGSIHHCLG